MTVYAFHTQYVSSPINDRRAGTYRVGSDDPRPIKITKGWDNVLNFAFRDHNQHPYLTIGVTITAHIYSSENVEVWTRNLIADPIIAGAASLIMPSMTSTTFNAGLYNLVLEITDEKGRTSVAHTTRSLPRFILEVIDLTTVSLNI